jgi:Secretion system C-terminal sorting domain
MTIFLFDCRYIGTVFGNAAAIPHGYTYQVPAGSVIKNGQWHTIQVKPCDGSFLPHHNNSSQTSLQCAGGQGNRIGVFDNAVISSPEELNINKGLKIYPIPSSDEINVEFELETSEKTVLYVYSVDGKMLKTFEKISEKGVNHLKINILDLVDGKYEILLISESKQISTSFIKL